MLYLGYAVIENILQVNVKDNYYTKLEDFEYEIKLKNLSADEISREFQRQFLGFFINDWIQMQMKTFEFHKYSHEERICNLNDQLSELGIMYNDDEANLEYLNKKREILTKIENNLEYYKSHALQQLELLRITFSNNSNNLEIIERHALLNLINKIEEEIN